MATVRFEVRRRLPFGQSLFVCGSLPELGQWKATNAVALRWGEGDVWTGELQLPAGTTVEYKYLSTITGEPASAQWESCENRQAETRAAGSVLVLREAFMSAPTSMDFVLRSAAFKDVIFGRRHPVAADRLVPDATGLAVQLEAYAWRVESEDELVVVGSIPQLGSWNLSNALKMADASCPNWRATLNIHPEQMPFTYKYCIRRKNDTPIWDDGPDRVFDYSAASASTSVSGVAVKVQDLPFRYPNNRQALDWRGSGVAIPVFSLRSKQSLGVGEFLDLKLLVDWAVKTGNRMIQVLPINDTTVTKTWVDSYPYSALSVFALHPIYLRVDEIDSSVAPKVEEIRASPAFADTIDLDYEAVMKAKMDIIRGIFSIQKDSLAADNELKEFVAENASWLKPYALCRALGEEFGTADHWEWPEGLDKITAAKIEEYTAPSSRFYNEVLLNYFIQWHLHKQLLQASIYAREHGVVIKGDLPIGVDRRSVDTWVNPSLFKMETSTGAPPDYFSEAGQNWGFPTYNWEEMAKDDYSWWKERLRTLDKYFTCIRIDHVLGFFRIWEIPEDCVSGMLGHFHPSIPIHRSELESVGIWDVERLCTPQVHHDALASALGADKAREVVDRFFVHQGHGHYKFKPELSSEKAIVAAAGDDEALKTKLMSILHDICLLRDRHDSNKFYPRFALYKTGVYASLPNAWKEHLYRLHNSYFFERQEDLWRGVGSDRLAMMKNNCKMLICAEDLGMVPECVPPVLYDMGLLGLRIQRMPKDPKKDFDMPWEYPYLTVCTPSCHDCSTVRGWWEENRDVSQKFYNQILRQHGGAPHYCEPWVAQIVVEQHLLSDSMWAVFPLQDLLAMDEGLRRKNPFEEQINNPANRYHYWKYRMHIDLESLIAADDFNSKLRSIIARSRRDSAY